MNSFLAESVWGEDLVWLVIGAVALGLLCECCIALIERIAKSLGSSDAPTDDDRCTWCIGTGEVTSFDDTFFDKQDPCPICKGSGKRWG